MRLQNQALPPVNTNLPLLQDNLVPQALRGHLMSCPFDLEGICVLVPRPDLSMLSD